MRGRDAVRERGMERERENVFIENSKGIIVTKFIQLRPGMPRSIMRLGRFKRHSWKKRGEGRGGEREGVRETEK